VIVGGVETSACSLVRVIICNVVEKKRKREERKKIFFGSGKPPN
jgi:hypothetical protein